MPDQFFRSSVHADLSEVPGIDTSVAHIARVYDFWLGGKDNFAVDREVGKKVLEIHPETVLSVRANRAFLARSVRYLAEQGIRQFLDVGTGLPSGNNTHEVAQAVAPESRVAYVDNDPIVLAHARALLTSSPDGETGYLDADIRNPGAILAGAAELLDFSKPVAVMLVAVLHMLTDAEGPGELVDRFMAAAPPGSFLVISHLASDVQHETMAEMGRRLNSSMTQQFTMRSRAQVAASSTASPWSTPGWCSPTSGGPLRRTTARYPACCGLASPARTEPAPLAPLRARAGCHLAHGTDASGALPRAGRRSAVG